MGRTHAASEFRDFETQLEQFAVNARRSPSGILGNHTEDQSANLFADALPPSYLPDSGDPSPIQTKPRPMPVHDGSRSDQDERLPPPGPDRSQRKPERAAGALWNTGSARDDHSSLTRFHFQPKAEAKRCSNRSSQIRSVCFPR